MAFDLQLRGFMSFLDKLDRALSEKLTDSARKHVSKKKEAFPSKHGKTGSYPMPDAKHAASAKGFAAMHHGKGSSVYKKVAAKAKSLGY